ncbi:MAG: Type restriction-modification system, specificity subunit [Candidatus Kaiserbacteria bacterium]|nr:Type restriction-modification system, specificity subunit [Candidatus Kaiserbacteria bacterium]
MTNHWQTKKLGEVTDLLVRGISPRYIDGGGTLVLNQKCIRNHEISYAEARRHDHISKKHSADKLIQVGDVLVNSTGVGTLGRVAQVRSIETPAVVDSHITIVRPKKNLFSNLFFGWAMMYVEDLIKGLGAGASGQTELARSVLKEIQISYPVSIPEQKVIAKKLEEVFEKVTNANENAEKNLQNSKDLFESYLQSVFAKPIKSWSKKRLGDISTIIMGQSPKGKTYNTQGIGMPLINGPVEFSPGQLSETHITKYTTEPTKICKKGDLILCVRGSTTGKANIAGQDSCLGRGVASITAKNYIIDQDLLNIYIASLRNTIYKLGIGATFPNVSSDILSAIEIAFPPLNEQKAIVKRLNALSAETKRLEKIYEQKLADLEELKKSVLEQAFTVML